RAGRSPRPGEARPPSAWRARRQLRSRFSRMPRLRAASATERPSSVTSLTASALNSRVYVRRVCPMLDLLTKSLRSYLSAHHPWGSPRYAPNDRLLKSLVFAVVQKRMEFQQFLATLHGNYGFVIGHRQAGNYISEGSSDQKAFEDNARR